MNARTVIAFSLLLGLAQPELARAEKYTCTAAKEKAKVGVHRGNEVGIEEDDERRECRFSINGATTDSPPIELVIGGLNAIRNRQMARLLLENDVGPLANLLLAPSRVSSPPDQLISNLRGNARPLQDCFSAYDAGRVGFSTEGTDMRCRIAAPGSNLRQFGEVDAEITEPQLQLRITLSRRQSLYLFLPLSFHHRPP